MEAHLARITIADMIIEVEGAITCPVNLSRVIAS